MYADADMKLTTIIGTAIAAVGLAACGSPATPTVAPSLTSTVEPTVEATPTATPTPTLSPTPAVIPPPTIFPLRQSASNRYDWQAASQTPQDNWNIDYRSSPSGMWIKLTSSNAAIDFTTPSSAGTTVYVRWDSYPDAGISAALADTAPC
jgi:hypothetical protein